MTMKSRYDKYSLKNNRYYEYTIYPTVKVDDVNFNKILTTENTCRLDLLAKQYLGNSKYWWIIALVNDLPGDSIVVNKGIWLYIPKEVYNYVY